MALADDRARPAALEPEAPILDEVGRQAPPALLVAAARLDDREDRAPIGSTSAFDPPPGAIDKRLARADFPRLPRAAPVLNLQAVGEPLHLPLPANDFQETGPGTMKLSMAGLDVDSQRSVAGGRAQLLAADDARGRLQVETRLAWLFEYLQTDRTAAAFFRPGDKGIFAVQGLGYGSNWLILGVGLRWQLAGGWNGYAGYDGQVNGQQLFHIGSAGIEHAW